MCAEMEKGPTVTDEMAEVEQKEVGEEEEEEE